MEYRKRCYADEDGGTLPKESLQEDLARFHRIDKDNTGSITWWEFINFESIRILKKRSKVKWAHKIYCFKETGWLTNYPSDLPQNISRI